MFKLLFSAKKIKPSITSDKKIIKNFHWWRFQVKREMHRILFSGDTD